MVSAGSGVKFYPAIVSAVKYVACQLVIIRSDMVSAPFERESSMPNIEDLLIEMKKTVERSQICHRDNKYLELSFLMGILTGTALLIHELACNEQSKKSK